MMAFPTMAEAIDEYQYQNVQYSFILTRQMLIPEFKFKLS